MSDDAGYAARLKIDYPEKLDRLTTLFRLLTDQYPSTVEEQAIHLKIDYPGAATGAGAEVPDIDNLPRELTQPR